MECCPVLCDVVKTILDSMGGIERAVCRGISDGMQEYFTGVFPFNELVERDRHV